MNIIDQVHKRIQAGERVQAAEALALFHHPDLMAVGALAEEVNRLRNGDRVFYNVNRHINPTNVCALSCKFCAFSKKPGEAGAYEFSLDEILERARQAVAQGASEVHMVGGLHPRWKFERYTEMISAIKSSHPQLHVKALTAVEIDWLARRARKSVSQVLEELKAAGLDSMPGGGAEIFHPEIRDRICDTKVSAEQWIDIHRTAHGLGLRSNCTMLYGHIESHFHRVDHMQRLRDLQDETGGFNVFIPLSFQPFDNDMGIDLYTAGYDDLKTIAVARIFLDNFANIKAYWVMLGQDIAQIALNFGANDLDGTVTEEKISRMAGGRAGMVMTQGDLQQLILEAGKRAVERDTLYRPIVRPGQATSNPRPEAGDTETRPAGFGPKPATGSAPWMQDLVRGLGGSESMDTAGFEPEIRIDLGSYAPAAFDADANPGFAGWSERLQNCLIEAASGLAGLTDAAIGQLPDLPFTLNVLLGSARATAEESRQLADIAAAAKALAAESQGFPLRLVLSGDWIERFAGLDAAAIAAEVRRYKVLGAVCLQDLALETPAGRWADRLDLHQIVHESDLRTRFTFSLTRSLSTSGQPGSPDAEGLVGLDWELLAGRIQDLRRLQEKNGGFDGVYLVSHGPRRIGALEFVKAGAVVQAGLKDLVPVITPLFGIPSFSALDTTRLSGLTPLKYAPLLNLAGVREFGPVTFGPGSATAAICTEFTTHGRRPVLRNAGRELELDRLTPRLHKPLDPESMQELGIGTIVTAAQARAGRLLVPAMPLN